MNYYIPEKKDIIARIEKHKKYPSLVKTLQTKASWKYKFESSLEPINIPFPSFARKCKCKDVLCKSKDVLCLCCCEKAREFCLTRKSSVHVTE